MMKSFEQEWDKIRYVFYIEHCGYTLQDDLEGQDQRQEDKWEADAMNQGREAGGLNLRKGSKGQKETMDQTDNYLNCIW